jgi:uncharacterized protein YbaP (TraB family)
MFRPLFFILILGILAWTACGTAKHAGSKQVTASADTARLENALLWKVTHPEMKEPSYVFGTIHIIGDEEYFLPAGTEIALEKADRIVFEIDMKEMMDLGTQISMITKAFMKNETRLGDLISDEDYEMVEKHFADLGLPMMLLDRIKPMFLTVFASSEMSPDDISSGEMKSYEMEFFDFAQENEKETGGLETIDFQLSVFDSIPYKAQAEMLVESIRAEEEQTDLFQQMVDLYRNQDIEALYMAIGDEEMGAGEYEDLLVRNRNQRWMSGMREFMSAGSVFFAVGAGHLGGPNGVIRLLRKEGFVVAPIIQEENRPVRKY